MTDVERLLTEASPLPWTYTQRDDHQPRGVLKRTDIRSDEDLPSWPFRPPVPKKAIIQHASWYVHPPAADLELIVYAVNNVEAFLRLLSEAENLIAGFTPSDNAQCRSWLKEVDEFLGRTVPA